MAPFLGFFGFDFSLFNRLELTCVCPLSLSFLFHVFSLDIFWLELRVDGQLGPITSTGR